MEPKYLGGPGQHLGGPVPPRPQRRTAPVCTVSKTKFPQCLDPSFIFVRYFTNNQRYRPNCDYDLIYWTVCYNAMLHVNIKIMTSKQRWYLLLSYINNKINFFSVVKFVLEVCIFINGLVNTTQSNTLVHSIVPNKGVKFGAKIFRYFWDIAIFMLGYFMLPHLYSG